MSDDLSMLPETLRLAMSRLRPDPGLPNSIAALDGEAWRYIRAELLRLARENAELHNSALGGYEDGWHALRNERDALKAELAKLREDGERLLWIAKNGYALRSRVHGVYNALVWTSAVRGDEAINSLRFAVDRKRAQLLAEDEG